MNKEKPLALRIVHFHNGVLPYYMIVDENGQYYCCEKNEPLNLADSSWSPEHTLGYRFSGRRFASTIKNRLYKHLRAH